MSRRLPEPAPTISSVYLIPITVPIYLDGKRRLIATDWKRALELLRDSHGGRYGPLCVAAPHAPANESEQLLVEAHLAADDIEDLAVLCRQFEPGEGVAVDDFQLRVRQGTAIQRRAERCGSVSQASGCVSVVRQYRIGSRVWISVDRSNEAFKRQTAPTKMDLINAALRSYFGLKASNTFPGISPNCP